MDKLNIDYKKDLDKNFFLNKYTKENDLHIEFSYKSNFKNTKVLRDFVDNICKIYPFPGKFVSRAILIADEMNNNSIEYGSEFDEINYFRISVKKLNNDEYDISIESEDTGNGSHAKTSLEMETLRAHKLKIGKVDNTSVRGRGLFLIIVRLVDRLYFKDTKTGGLIVGIKKRLNINKEI